MRSTRGDVRSVAFVIPWGAVWSLPAYELALLTAAHVRERDAAGRRAHARHARGGTAAAVRATASEAVHALLEEHDVSLETGAYAAKFADGELDLIPEGRIPADRVVALPRLQGAPLDGLPQTVDGFIPVDSHCRVHGVADVFAAGDITSFTVKQGGIATQQADAAAEAIAAAAGASVTPQRFQAGPAWAPADGTPAALSPPRAQRSAGARAGRLLRAALVASGEDRGPPFGAVPCVAGRCRGPRDPRRSPSEAVPLEVELDREALEGLTASRLTFDEHEHDGGVDELMSKDLRRGRTRGHAGRSGRALPRAAARPRPRSRSTAG